MPKFSKDTMYSITPNGHYMVETLEKNFDSLSPTELNTYLVLKEFRTGAASEDTLANEVIIDARHDADLDLKYVIKMLLRLGYIEEMNNYYDDLSLEEADRLFTPTKPVSKSTLKETLQNFGFNVGKKASTFRHSTTKEVDIPTSFDEPPPEFNAARYR
jgi:hypothetical protein